MLYKIIYIIYIIALHWQLNERTVCGWRLPFPFGCHHICHTMSPKCTMAPSPWFDGFSSGLICGLGNILKAISNERALIMRCNKKRFFSMYESIQRSNYCSVFPDFNWVWNTWAGQSFCSLPTVDIKLKNNYSLTNISLDAVKRQTEAY